MLWFVVRTPLLLLVRTIMDLPSLTVVEITDAIFEIEGHTVVLLQALSCTAGLGLLLDRLLGVASETAVR